MNTERPVAGLEPLMTADDVAAVLGVARHRVYALVREGELPAIRLGSRRVRFSAQALAAWLSSGGSAARHDRDHGAPIPAPIAARSRQLVEIGGGPHRNGNGGRAPDG